MAGLAHGAKLWLGLIENKSARPESGGAGCGIITISRGPARSRGGWELVAVAVADEDVHEPRRQKRAGVHPVVGTGIETLEEARRREHPAEAAGVVHKSR